MRLVFVCYSPLYDSMLVLRKIYGTRYWVWHSFFFQAWEYAMHILSLYFPRALSFFFLLYAFPLFMALQLACALLFSLFAHYLKWSTGCQLWWSSIYKLEGQISPGLDFPCISDGSKVPLAFSLSCFVVLSGSQWGHSNIGHQWDSDLLCKKKKSSTFIYNAQRLFFIFYRRFIPFILLSRTD